MYFADFNTIPYDFTVNSDSTPKVEAIVDLMTRVNLNINQESMDKLCDSYAVSFKETPEIIAGKLYNNPFLHWTILYINGISDLHSEWPLEENALAAFVVRKYGADAQFDAHHYEKMPERLAIDPTFCLDIYGEEARMVTNYDYEYEKNELKRFIKVIKPVYVNQFVRSFKEALING